MKRPVFSFFLGFALAFALLVAGILWVDSQVSNPRYFFRPAHLDDGLVGSLIPQSLSSSKPVSASAPLASAELTSTSTAKPAAPSKTQLLPEPVSYIGDKKSVKVSSSTKALTSATPPKQLAVATAQPATPKVVLPHAPALAAPSTLKVKLPNQASKASSSDLASNTPSWAGNGSGYLAHLAELAQLNGQSAPNLYVHPEEALDAKAINSKPKAINAPVIQIPVDHAETEVMAIPSQFFLVNTGRDTLLRGARGTIIHVPAQTFVTQSQTVRIELREALYPLKTQLQQLKHSIAYGTDYVDASVYLAADVNGKPLQMVAAKQVYVEIPASLPRLSQQTLQDAGHVVRSYSDLRWNPAPQQVRTLVELPLSALAFSSLLDSRVQNRSELLQLLNGHGAQGTFVATREFAERLEFLTTRPELVYGAVKVYFQLRTQQLHEADQAVMIWLRNQLANELAAGGPAAAQATVFLQQFSFFAQQGLTTVRPMYQYAVDLDRADAVTQLVLNGYGTDEAREIVRLHQLRSYVVAQMKAGGGHGQVHKYAYQLSELGWIVADYRYTGSALASN